MQQNSQARLNTLNSCLNDMWKSMVTERLSDFSAIEAYSSIEKHDWLFRGPLIHEWTDIWRRNIFRFILNAVEHFALADFGKKHADTRDKQNVLLSLRLNLTREQWSTEDCSRDAHLDEMTMNRRQASITGFKLFRHDAWSKCSIVGTCFIWISRHGHFNSERIHA